MFNVYPGLPLIKLLALADGTTFDHSSDQTAGNKTATVVAATDIWTANTHGLVSGQMVHLTSATTLPAGFAASTDYYVNRIDANTFYLMTNYADAIAGTNPVNATDTGTGTHTVRVPVFAYYGPTAPHTVRLTSLTAYYTDGTGGLDNEFGNLNAALTYGLRFYVRRSGQWAYEFTNKYAWNVKTNADWSLWPADYEITVIAGGNDIFQAVMNFDISFGAPIRLGPGEQIVMWMNDDLSALTTLYTSVTGVYESVDQGGVAP